MKEKDYTEDLGGRVVLRWIFRKWHGRARIRLIWLRIQTDGWGAVNTVMDLGVLYSAVSHVVRRCWQIVELHIFGFRI